MTAGDRWCIASCILRSHVKAEVPWQITRAVSSLLGPEARGEMRGRVCPGRSACSACSLCSLCCASVHVQALAAYALGQLTGQLGRVRDAVAVAQWKTQAAKATVLKKSPSTFYRSRVMLSWQFACMEMGRILVTLCELSMSCLGVIESSIEQGTSPAAAS